MAVDKGQNLSLSEVEIICYVVELYEIWLSTTISQGGYAVLKTGYKIKKEKKERKKNILIERK